ncbi:MAG: hypothetical protein IJT16_04800 [Lachnospiraceae bacterium]|nr:hypothetical protein [Lachnospiraceae bacterium]
MNRFECDNAYEKDLKEFSEQLLEKAGVYSPAAEREIMCLADSGNLIACKLYADLIYYKKVPRKEPFREAFSLYLKSAGLCIDETGAVSCDGPSYPLAFWIVGYYLVNYKKESLLQSCETIDGIEAMSDPDRLSTALELSAACIHYVDAPGALNLIGRILAEASREETVFKALMPVIRESLNVSCDSPEKCSALSEEYFEKAAEKGYIYAANNLAAKEADRILSLSKEEEQNGLLTVHLEKYIKNLKLSADRFEPYAANRLGLFYMNGEIRNGDDKKVFREYVDFSLAKEYFLKATKYPDANSAWAYFNLIKYFHKDYDRNIELLNEHMDYIRMLNPKIYDLAIEL